MSPRIICRLAVFDEKHLLLVRNENLPYWYPPGGGWEPGETLPECGAREVFEETRLRVEVGELLFVQEFYGEGKHERSLELTFLATLADGKSEPHIPKQEHLAEARWFNYEEVRKLTVYPPQMKEVWRLGPKRESTHSTYIGVATDESGSGEQ